MLLCPYFLPERGSEASLSYKATMASNITTTPNSANNKRTVGIPSNSDILLNDGLGGTSSVIDNGLSEEQKEQIRFSQVGRKKDFVHMEKIDGKSTNVLKGLELHTKVFNSEEQKNIVECVYNLQRMGQKGQLSGTFVENLTFMLVFVSVIVMRFRIHLIHLLTRR